MKERSLLVIEDSSKADFGGGQRVTIAVLDAAKRGWRVLLADHGRGTQFQDHARFRAASFIRLRGRGTIVGGTRQSLSVGWLEVLTSITSLPVDACRLVRFMRRCGCSPSDTVVYAATKKALLLALLLRLMAGFRYVFHAHSVDERGRLLYAPVRLALSRAERVVCVSRAVMAALGNLPNASVVHNGVPSLSRSRAYLNGPPYVVASFSTLIKCKGIEYFVRSHAALRNVDIVSYWVFGDGDDRRRLQALGSRQILFKGFLVDALRVLASEVSVVVVPSIIPEACPMVVLEALSAGIPVITTGMGGQAELVTAGRAGIHVPPRDPAAIAFWVDRLVEDPSLYKRLSSSALARAADFTEARFAERVLRVLDSVLPPSPLVRLPSPRRTRG